MAETAVCIYCLQEKPKSEFNREHVISRMLGTYKNAPVLNHCEVCKECNSFFSNELESVISLDSCEGLLRTQHIKKNHSSIGRPIGKTRLCITGQNGIFKGLRFFISLNPNYPENIQVEPEPSVGIISEPEKNEYEYYHLELIPNNTTDIHDRMKRSSKPIIFFGYDEKEVFEALLSKGYNVSKENYSGNVKISDISAENKLEVEIKSKVDSLLWRLETKNIFNYLCFQYGKEYVLNTKFDTLRSFICKGDIISNLQLYVKSNGIKGIPCETVDEHIIGTALAAADDLYLCGFVSWFREVTYCIVIEKWPYGTVFPEMSFTICDNQRNEIFEMNNPLCLEWPNSKFTVTVCGNSVVLIPKA